MEGLSFQDIWDEMKEKEWDAKYLKKDTTQNGNTVE